MRLVSSRQDLSCHEARLIMLQGKTYLVTRQDSMQDKTTQTQATQDETRYHKIQKGKEKRRRDRATHQDQIRQDMANS